MFETWGAVIVSVIGLAAIALQAWLQARAERKESDVDVHRQKFRKALGEDNHAGSVDALAADQHDRVLDALGGDRRQRDGGGPQEHTGQPGQ